MMLARIAKGAAVSLALALEACSGGLSLTPVEVLPPAQAVVPRLTVESEERPFVSADRPEWGLALSGGGLRSAMFSVGLLKAMRDSDVLERIDMVSSVSGGGYTAFWLYGRHQAGHDDGVAFGEGSLNDSQFDNQLCEFASRGNFVTYGRLAGLLRPGMNRLAVDLYENALMRTFAGGRDARRITIAELSRSMGPGERQAPFLVQNASIVADGRAWNGRLLEFTALSYGNAERRVPWSAGPDHDRLPFVQVTAVSGAAVATLDQRLALYDPGAPFDHPAGMTAGDGGRTENLGAFALIRRGVRNVIISDAEHDPGYIFSAYRTLRAGLATQGLDLRIPLIQDHLLYNGNAPFGHWLARGEVRLAATGEHVSTIYYIKATLTPGMLAAMGQQDRPEAPGKVDAARFASALAASRDARGNWQCDRIAIQPYLDLRSWSEYSVFRYATWLRNSLKARAIRSTRIAAAAIDFPQYSTGDQSFFTDQTRAFIGLGYLEGMELGETLRRPQSAQ